MHALAKAIRDCDPKHAPSADPFRPVIAREATNKGDHGAENRECLVGLHGPRKSIARFPGWTEVGATIEDVVDNAARRAPALPRALQRLAADPTAASELEAPLREAGAAVADMLAEEWRLQRETGTGHRHKLPREIVVQAADLDRGVAVWCAGHTPLGIKVPLQLHGVVPHAPPRDTALASEVYRAENLANSWKHANYDSFLMHGNAANAVIARLTQRGHSVVTDGACKASRSGRAPRSSEDASRHCCPGSRSARSTPTPLACTPTSTTSSSS